MYAQPPTDNLTFASMAKSLLTHDLSDRDFPNSSRMQDENSRANFFEDSMNYSYSLSSFGLFIHQILSYWSALSFHTHIIGTTTATPTDLTPNESIRDACFSPYCAKIFLFQAPWCIRSWSESIFIY